MDLEFNKNDDRMRLLISEMKRKHANICLGGGKNKIKKQHHTYKRTKKRSYGRSSNKKNTKHNKRTQKYGYHNKNNKITPSLYSNSKIIIYFLLILN